MEREKVQARRVREGARMRSRRETLFVILSVEEAHTTVASKYLLPRKEKDILHLSLSMGNQRDIAVDNQPPVSKVAQSERK